MREEIREREGRAERKMKLSTHATPSGIPHSLTPPPPATLLIPTSLLFLPLFPPLAPSSLPPPLPSTHSMEEVPAVDEGGLPHEEAVDLLHVGRGTGQHPLLLQRVDIVILIRRSRQRALIVPALLVVDLRGGGGGGREEGEGRGGEEGGREESKVMHMNSLRDMQLYSTLCT